MRKIKNLYFALILLVVSGAIVTLSSYAWFSMNRQVSASGIEMRATSPSNMLIKGTADSDFSGVGRALPLTNKIFPSSTVDGMSFFALSDGQYVGNSGVASSDSVFDDVSGKYVGLDDKDGYYGEYLFILKSLGGNEAKTEIRSITVTTDTASTLDKTIRVAVFEKNDDTLTLRAFKAADLESVNAIKTINADGSINETSVTFAENDGYFTVKGDGTEITIVVRVWMEGQHSECINTNANYSIDLNILFAISEE